MQTQQTQQTNQSIHYNNYNNKTDWCKNEFVELAKLDLDMQDHSIMINQINH